MNFNMKSRTKDEPTERKILEVNRKSNLLSHIRPSMNYALSKTSRAVTTRIAIKSNCNVMY